MKMEPIDTTTKDPTRPVLLLTPEQYREGYNFLVNGVIISRPYLSPIKTYPNGNVLVYAPTEEQAMEGITLVWEGRDWAANEQDMRTLARRALQHQAAEQLRLSSMSPGDQARAIQEWAEKLVLDLSQYGD